MGLVKESKSDQISSLLSAVYLIIFRESKGKYKLPGLRVPTHCLTAGTFIGPIFSPDFC